MKKLILLVLAGIALFTFIVTTSFLWYRFFYSSSYNDSSGVIKVNLKNENNTINESGLIPLDDETARKLIPYEFSVENSSADSFTYNVLLEDSVISDDATYSTKELLSRNQLRYQLSLNGKVIKIGNLSDIKNNILDTRVISSLETNNYQLRIYVSEEAQNTNWQNKYYHFDVNVKMEDSI